MTTTAERIAELTAAWEDAVNYGEAEPTHRASDYSLSEDDWKAGLSDEEAAEIVALIERQAENQQRAGRIATGEDLPEARTLAEYQRAYHESDAAYFMSIYETEV